jgi:hypothetical protein
MQYAFRALYSPLTALFVLRVSASPCLPFSVCFVSPCNALIPSFRVPQCFVSQGFPVICPLLTSPLNWLYLLHG